MAEESCCLQDHRGDDRRGEGPSGPQQRMSVGERSFRFAPDKKAFERGGIELSDSDGEDAELDADVVASGELAHSDLPRGNGGGGRWRSKEPLTQCWAAGGGGCNIEQLQHARWSGDGQVRCIRVVREID